LNWESVSRSVPLKTLTTLKAGGEAELFAKATNTPELVEIAAACQLEGVKVTPLGWGSNFLPSDSGVKGLVLVNQTRAIQIDGDVVIADSGVAFQDLWLKSTQAGLVGLEFAVGIPGTVGGALVSYAGAYRSNISEFLIELEIVQDGKADWVDPSWMEFRYRDSVLRCESPRLAVIARTRFRLPKGEAKKSYDEAREYQRQRIGKQPPSASAGSFFKNVIDAKLASEIEGLSDGMRKNNVVPAGFLIEQCGLKGFRLGGAMIGKKHANFLLNVAGATASELRSLAEYAKREVKAKFEVDLEEEVMYIGDWTNFQPISP
jgi:UDP-N-acetylmuramate dehydrogenase